MKTCPNCGELIGDNVDSCFKCKYDFRHRRVVSQEERIKQREEYQRHIDSLSAERDRKLADEAKIKQEFEEHMKELDLKSYYAYREHSVYREKADTLAPFLNDVYEYDVVAVSDGSHGIPSLKLIQSVLDEHAKACWRLVCVTTNEIGKNSSVIGIGPLASGVNATVDATLLIFERRIFSPTYKP